MRRGKCVNCGQTSVRLTDEDAALNDKLQARIKQLEAALREIVRQAPRKEHFAPTLAQAVLDNPPKGSDSVSECTPCVAAGIDTCDHVQRASEARVIDRAYATPEEVAAAIKHAVQTGTTLTILEKGKARSQIVTPKPVVEECTKEAKADATCSTCGKSYVYWAGKACSCGSTQCPNEARPEGCDCWGSSTCSVCDPENTGRRTVHRSDSASPEHGQLWVAFTPDGIAVSIFQSREACEEDARTYGGGEWKIAGPYVLQRTEPARNCPHGEPEEIYCGLCDEQTKNAIEAARADEREHIARMVEEGDPWEGHQAPGNAPTIDPQPLFMLRDAIVERIRDGRQPARTETPWRRTVQVAIVELETAKSRLECVADDTADRARNSVEGAIAMLETLTEKDESHDAQ